VLMPKRVVAAGGIFAALWGICAFATVSAQTNRESSIDDTANQIATFLSDLRASTVTVRDFVGPVPESSALRSMLADQFTAALARKSASVAVASRRLRGQGPPDTLSASSSNAPTGGDAGALATVEGEFWNGDNFLAIDVRVSVKPKDPKAQIERFNTNYTLPVPPEFKGAVGVALPPYPRAGKNGYTTPRCIRCARADYPDAAMRNKTAGTIKLDVVVDSEGRIGEFRVAEGLPDGLTEAAINCVSAWQLTPASGPDGQPATVIMTLEVMFQLF
jgi:TonB family protein